MSNRVKVDGLITSVPGQWKFDEEVARHFDEHVRKSIPLYEELQSMVIEMSEWLITDGSVVYDIGSSTGETLNRLADKHAGKLDVRFVGVETSEAMVKSARAKCESPAVRFVQKNVMEIERFEGADLVLSLYTFQFLPLKHRSVLMKRIYDALSPGGALILAEKIQAESPRLEDMWMELHWDFKRRRGLTDEMILQKARSLRGVMFPLTLSRNVELLESAGFSDTEVFLKWHNFAGMIAFKRRADDETRDRPDRLIRRISTSRGRGPLKG
ncbi:MAG: methyltransferase domain-containing protein [Gemmatimonadetes bacterium]|nr:methyltransferase domain-containing protein [Gemmatimonadota bacterium]